MKLFADSKNLSIIPSPEFNTTKAKVLKSLLCEYKGEHSPSHECTRDISSVVDCCDYLIETLGGRHHGK